jgi:hypothetical protein
MDMYFARENIVEAGPLDFLNQALEGRVEFRTENHDGIKIEYFVDINYGIAPHNIYFGSSGQIKLLALPLIQNPQQIKVGNIIVMKQR